MASFLSRIKQPHELLNHILDQPDLPAIIERLEPRVLTRLIRHVGLEDCSQIVSLATTDQLNGIFDEDLWQSETPGRPETFDTRRFGLWLEVMLEAGAAQAALKIITLDEDLVTLGICRLVWVVGMGDAAVQQEGGGDVLQRIIDNAEILRFGSYLVMAKNQWCWDTVCKLLVELNESAYEYLERLLERCRRISLDALADQDGNYGVCSADEMIGEDVSADREERREGKGFVTPTSAAVFLSQARSTALPKILAAEEMPHTARAYFRSFETDAAAGASFQATGTSSNRRDTGSLDQKTSNFIQTLRDADVLPAADPKMLAGEGSRNPEADLPLARAMDAVFAADPALYFQRLSELSYLSNTLMAGCRFKGRTFQTQEAAHAAFAVCNLGAEHVLAKDDRREDRPAEASLVQLLRKDHLVNLFQAGWHILYTDVAIYTAKALLEFIHGLRDAAKYKEQANELTLLGKRLKTHIASGKPWAFCSDMDDLLGFLDGETTAALTELLRELPTQADAVCKNGGRETSHFISSRADIVSVWRFLRQAGASFPIKKSSHTS